MNVIPLKMSFHGDSGPAFILPNRSILEGKGLYINKIHA